jgi:ABC-2 type transport system permease protein
MSDAAAISMAPANSAPELKLVTGPSALGTTPKRFWNLLWLTSVTDFRLRYVHSSLGYVWTLLRPLLFFGIVFVFIRKALGFGGGIENYAPMLMLNIIIYSFFQETTTQGIRALVGREALVRKMRFPRLVIPLSIALTGLMTLLINILVGLTLSVILGVTITWTWLLLPVAVIWVALITTGVEVFLAAAYVRFRDVGQVWMIIGRVLFYGSPILYPIEIVHGTLRTIILCNPLTPVFVDMRHWITDPSAPAFLDVANTPLTIIAPFALAVFAMIAGLWFFIREAPNVGESL